MIVILIIIYNQNRMSSITRVLHTATWHYITSSLSDRFIRSPEVVKEAIITDINDFVQELCRTSTGRNDGESILAMRRLHDILRQCLEVCLFGDCRRLS